MEVGQPQEETLEKFEADIDWSSVDSADEIMNVQVNNASRSACSSIHEDYGADIEKSRVDSTDKPENVRDSNVCEKN